MEYKIKNEIEIPEQIFDARYHPAEGKELAGVVTISGNVHLIESGILKTKIRKHHKGSPIRKIRWNKDGHMVTIAKTVKVYDLAAEQTLHTLKRDDGKTSTFYSVIPLTGNIICAGDDDGTLFAWDTRTPEKPVFVSHDCEQYISDMDGRHEGRRLLVCTSGEGTLTAYDMRANKKIEPQSELFEAGFQCVKLVESNKKVVIGGEDGAIYVFNQNEWAHTSGKFAVSDDQRNRGKCSIDAIDVLQDDSTFLAGCSDGRLRTLTLWPHQVLTEKVVCKKSPIECLHVNPHGSDILVGGETYINIVSFEEKSGDSDAESGDSHSDSTMDSDTADDSDDSGEDHAKNEQDSGEPEPKRSKTCNDDYLNIFN